MTIANPLPLFRDALPAGRVIDDPDLIAPWTSDWRGKYHGAAAAILSPRNVEEVSAILRIAAAHGIALVPQGGNSSMVGGATPPADGKALILSLRAMNAIRSIDADANLAVCEAGVILQTLHEAVEAAGRRFPLTLGAKGVATVGGLISTNAGGTQVLRHGPMRAQVEGLEAVWPNGSILNGLAALKKDNRGYDLKQVLIGAEGTIGVITAASLRLVPTIASRTVFWAGVASTAQALALLRHLEEALGEAVEGFEILSDEIVDVVLSEVPGTRKPIASPAPWHVLVEAVTADPGDADALRARVEAALADALEKDRLTDATIASSEGQADAFWRIRESVSSSEKAKGPAMQYDISVPVGAMPAFMIDAARACEGHFPGSTAQSYGHLGDGNIHFHVRPPRDPADRGAHWIAEQGEAVSRFVNDLVAAAGGSISAEHGIGQMKVAELARLASPAHLVGLRAIKGAFDPGGIMNPGKLVPPAP
ncbi:FAD-binding oxidoreductase [Sphingobium sufflavum]|uniref:FAD-binding oxidoreductase n=1 Tax=Sphingobium sufflavum TaxID=1129547 RepID=UPI001F26E85D|nr:FAD-binding oxidoreductase [Sphingobium sufflavum]MCE7797322.1 FAD-binding oxidoreductase [Sphingobium sufflavum]